MLAPLFCLASASFANAPADAIDRPSAATAESEAPSESSEVIVVYGRALNQIGVATSGSQGVVGYADFEDRPLSRVGELAENVPGLIATQHSGTGKANQYFLRGFNLDHGTDLAGFVNGVPINLRSHGHGQGYLDLNFLIPELVRRIDYRKGPYFADVGDFSGAGTIAFETVDTLSAPLVEAIVGSFGYYRALAAGSGAVGDGQLLLALDAARSDGPWVLDERLRRINGAVKYSSGSADRGWSVGFSGYRATWQATDQVPRRAIAAGLIDRFGFIDPYLGGETTRLGVTGNARFGDLRLTAYALHYDFSLTSNFTYFLADPVNGDEFRQRDRRAVFGGSLSRRLDTAVAGLPVAMTLGGDLRYDRIGRVGLYRSTMGETSSTIRQDRIDEYSGALHGSAEIALGARLRAVFGLRGDLYGYSVKAGLAANSGSGSDVLVQPKATLAWRATDHFELYANFGDSFHSNDVRGASIRVDPVTGDQAARVPVFVRARGAELGARAEYPRFAASLVAYRLTLGSELVFVGDAGSTEPNAASRRYGIEANLFWQPFGWLTLDGAAAFTHARFHDVDPGADHIPNSVDEVLSAGATLRSGAFTITARLRHFGSAPLIENGSVHSRPTTLANLGLYYELGRARLGLDILNLFDSRHNDITYFYPSRLPGEPADGVEDEHLHPVEPRQARISLRWAF